MSVFAVIAGNNSEKSLATKVAKAYPGDLHISIENDNWLIFEPNFLPPKAICDKIIGKDKINERLLVITVESYWGVHDSKIWAWLGSKKL